MGSVMQADLVLSLPKIRRLALPSYHLLALNGISYDSSHFAPPCFGSTQDTTEDVISPALFEIFYKYFYKPRIDLIFSYFYGKMITLLNSNQYIAKKRGSHG